MATSQADSPNHPQGKQNDEAYVRLIVQHQGLLFAYLRAILNSSADAEEVLQETCVVLWRKRQQFEVGTNFISWATTIARYTVRKFRRNRKQFPHVLDEELLSQIATELAAELAADDNVIDARHRALAQCMERLSDRDRHLIRAAYAINTTHKDTSQKLGMTPNSFYKALNRIRQRLQKCIEYRLIAEGRA